MIKRILCTVVRSVPLSKTSDTLLHAEQLSDGHHKTGDIAAANVRFGHTSNSVFYTSRSGIAKVTVDNNPIGQILDCYI